MTNTVVVPVAHKISENRRGGDLEGRGGGGGEEI
jgi:hypothetical protein